MAGSVAALVRFVCEHACEHVLGWPLANTTVLAARAAVSGACSGRAGCVNNVTPLAHGACGTVVPHVYVNTIPLVCGRDHLFGYENRPAQQVAARCGAAIGYGRVVGAYSKTFHSANAKSCHFSWRCLVLLFMQHAVFTHGTVVV